MQLRYITINLNDPCEASEKVHDYLCQYLVCPSVFYTISAKTVQVFEFTEKFRIDDEK
jgi:hypothetical protein